MYNENGKEVKMQEETNMIIDNNPLGMEAVKASEHSA